MNYIQTIQRMKKKKSGDNYLYIINSFGMFCFQDFTVHLKISELKFFRYIRIMRHWEYIILQTQLLFFFVPLNKLRI